MSFYKHCVQFQSSKNLSSSRIHTGLSYSLAGKILCVFLAVVLSICCIPALPLSQQTAWASISEESIQKVCAEYNFIDGYYWKTGASAESTTTGTEATGDATATQSTEVTEPEREYSGHATNEGEGYSFKGATQCVGFAQFMAYELTGSLYTDSSNWYEFELTDTSILQPGDVVYAPGSPHAAMVYSVETTETVVEQPVEASSAETITGTLAATAENVTASTQAASASTTQVKETTQVTQKLTFIECWGSSDNEINIGPFNSYYDSAAEILEKYGASVAYRYKGDISEAEQSPTTEYGEDFYAYLSQENAGLKLEATAGSNMVQLASSASTSTPAQLWHFVLEGEDSYRITNEYSGLCLEAVLPSTDEETQESANQSVQIQVNAAAESDSQLWRIFKDDSGISLMPLNSDQIMTLTFNEGAEPGLTLDAQKFSLTQVLTLTVIADGTENYVKATPAAPLISVVSNSGKVRVSWTKSELVGTFDSREYVILVHSGISEDGPLVLKQAVKDTDFYDIRLKPGQYTVTVRAVNAFYDSVYSDSRALSFLERDAVQPSGTAAASTVLPFMTISK